MNRTEAAAKAMDEANPYREPDGSSWPEWEQEAQAALAAADAHDAAHGIHRVAIDEATVERGAVALYVHNNPVGNWSAHSARVKNQYRTIARAVLAAAVEAGQ